MTTKTESRPTAPGAHLKLSGKWLHLPEAKPFDTIRWERHFGISQALAMTAEPPLMEHLLYTFFLLAQRADAEVPSDFEEFVDAVEDMELVEEPEDPQGSDQEPSA